MKSARSWQCAAKTHPGKRRRINEDAVLSRPEVGLWAVADGMGGHAAGDFAAQSITEGLVGISGGGTLSECVDAVDDLLCRVNAALRDHSERCCEGRTVGSTVVTLLCNGIVGVALWAGDSRLYRFRDGELQQVTRDHNPMAELLDDGVITEHTAQQRDSNIVTRAVGGHGDLYLDVAVFDVRPGDTFLLCSDGLYRELTDVEMGCLLRSSSAQASVDDLIEASLARGARDNVSAVVARFSGPSRP